MKKNKPNRYCFIACVVFILFLNGCMSVSNSPNPRFYTLYASDKEKNSQEFNIPANTIIGIGPVRIPEYLNRPQIVTNNKDKTIFFDEFNRWAESLDFALARLINNDLTLIIPKTSLQMFPWDLTIAVKYQVIVDVVQLENNLNHDLLFVTQWSIIDLEKKRAVFTKRSEFRHDIYPHNYYGLTEALSAATMSLSKEVAQGLVSVVKPAQPE
ncbi:MAG: PqiC family protein [Candidatus Omnitrophica bacterium]|nr:PqiC family protein [Candidatus Omnitrophota bacterium]